MTARRVTTSGPGSETDSPGDHAIKVTRRRGATHPSFVPEDVLSYLHQGGTARNFMEIIALDFEKLFFATFSNAPCSTDGLRDPRLVRRMRAGGETILRSFGPDAMESIIGHGSDTVRGWCAFAIAEIPGLSDSQRLERMSPLLRDSHFAVREWAWLAFRKYVIDNPIPSLDLLHPLAKDSDHRARRFACEVTRPIGVWSRHIPEFKAEPSRALQLLTTLRNEQHKYVQDSLGNWLNDAARTNPEWVRALCQSWLSQAPASPPYLIRRAMRSLASA